MHAPIEVPPGTFHFSSALGTLPDVMPVGARPTQATLEPTANGTHILRGIRIFRTGSFKDSRGIRRTWTSQHLDLMVANFYHLSAQGILAHVPIRADHTVSVKDVVGYFRDVYRDPTDQRFLAADIEFTEAAAADKWNRGTFRSRSAEIGQYEDNDGNPYFPTVLGLAFVDIGAVEGLYGADDGKAIRFSHPVLDLGENVDPNSLEAWIQAGRTAEQWAAAVNYAWSQACEYAAWLEAAEYAQALQDHYQNATQLGIESTNPQQPPAPPLPGNLPGGNQNHQRPAGSPAPQAQPVASFSLNGGTPVTDPVAIQAHIHALEQFRDETTSTGRTDYVNQLARDNRLPQTQVAATQALVATFSDEQFAQYRTTMDNAPVHSLLQPQGGTGGNGQQNHQQAPPPGGGGFGSPVPGQNASDDDMSIAEGIVTQHRNAGKTADFIKETPSYKKLLAAGRAPTL